MLMFRVDDMTCGHCASTIARAVAQVDRDARVQVNIGEKIVSVIADASENDISDAIRDAGYTPQRLADAAPRTSAAGGGCCCGARKQPA